MNLSLIHVLTDLQIDPRIRTDYGDLADLQASILEHGILSSLVVDTSVVPYRLIAGGRRTAACRGLLEAGETSPGWDGSGLVPARLISCPEDWRRLDMEMDENLKRKDMTWQEKVLGLYERHRLRQLQSITVGESWGQKETGELLGISIGQVNYSLLVARALRKADQDILTAPSMTEALRILMKRKESEILKNKFEKIASAKVSSGINPLETDMAALLGVGTEAVPIKKTPRTIIPFGEALPFQTPALMFFQYKAYGEFPTGAGIPRGDDILIIHADFSDYEYIYGWATTNKLGFTSQPFIWFAIGRRKDKSQLFPGTAEPLFFLWAEGCKFPPALSLPYISENGQADAILSKNPKCLDSRVYQHLIENLGKGKTILLLDQIDTFGLRAGIRFGEKVVATFANQATYDQALLDFPA